MAENRVYGYARVSTKEQHEDRQIEALKAYGVKEENILTDKASGKDMDRVSYRYLKEKLLREGDTLVIKELDRLSRRKDDIKKELEDFKALGVRVKILDIPTTLIDFDGGDVSANWVLEMISNILIEVLGAIAENERNKIKKRQQEGIAVALEKGVHFGKPALVYDKEAFKREYEKVERGEQMAVEAMKALGMTKGSFYKVRKRYLAKVDEWKE